LIPERFDPHSSLGKTFQAQDSKKIKLALLSSLLFEKQPENQRIKPDFLIF
jgi:hypothetical protein